MKNLWHVDNGALYSLCDVAKAAGSIEPGRHITNLYSSMRLTSKSLCLSLMYLTESVGGWG